MTLAKVTWLAKSQPRPLSGWLRCYVQQLSPCKETPRLLVLICERAEDWVGGGWGGREGGPQAHGVLVGRPRREWEGCQALPRVLAHLRWGVARA